MSTLQLFALVTVGSPPEDKDELHDVINGLLSDTPQACADIRSWALAALDNNDITLDDGLDWTLSGGGNYGVHYGHGNSSYDFGISGLFFEYYMYVEPDYDRIARVVIHESAHHNGSLGDHSDSPSAYDYEFECLVV